MQDLIAKQLEQSKHWRSLNTASMEIHRWEGRLAEPAFNRSLIEHLMPFQDHFGAIHHYYACGFEIEFYLAEEKISSLEEAIAEQLPESQMLLIDLKQPIKTNGRNFYLMAENTGKPPEGMRSYELVSPILDPKSLPYFLSSLLSTLSHFQALDDQHLGFHLHISTQDPEPISPIALLYFLAQQGCFNWPERQFSRDLVAQFFDYQPQDWQLIFEEITRKCYNLNLLHFADHNRIELRALGGEGYLQQTQTIIDFCLQALQAFELAQTTPITKVAEQIRQEYTLAKQIQPLSQIDSQTLLHGKESNMCNQLWFANVRRTLD